MAAATALSVDEMLGPDPAFSSPSGADRAVPPAVSAVPAGGTPDIDAIAGDAFEGASRTSRELASWSPPTGSADALLLPGKPYADSRSEDMLRNDAYVAGGRSLHQDTLVGALYLLNAKPETRILWGREDETWEAEFQEEVETKFTLYAESNDNWIDASRTNTLTGLVRLVIGIYAACGEIVSAAEWMPDDGRAFRTAINLIEIERLSDPHDRFVNQRTIVRGGVEKDSKGAPIAYYIRQALNDDWANPLYNKWRRVPIRKPWGRQMMLHLFEQHRPEQSRGVSQMTSALAEMRMTKDHRRYVLQKAIVDATYAATIESDLPPEAAYQAIGGAAGDTSAFGAAAIDYLQAIQSFSKGAQNLNIGGVKIPHLYPGSKLNIRPAGQGGPLGNEFEQSLLRYIAANLGVSYEQLSRDYTNTNYSSARAAMLETWKYMQSRKKMVADRFATWIYRLWLEEAINKNQIETLKRRNVPNFYEGQNKDA